MQEDGVVANGLAAPSHWKMLSRVKTWRGVGFVFTRKDVNYAILPSACEEVVVMFTGERLV